MIPSLRIRNNDGKEQILCPFRRKWVRLTPEEQVRQNFLHRLVTELAYPLTHIAVEHPIQVGDAKKRCDAVVMDCSLQPRCIIEFKAPNVAVTEMTFDQIAVYNRRLGVPYLMVSNGRQTFVCYVHTDHTLEFLSDIPPYNSLCMNN